MYFLLHTRSCSFVYVHLCAHMCVGQRSVLAVFHDHSTPFVFIQGLSVNLVLTDSNWFGCLPSPKDWSIRHLIQDAGFPWERMVKVSFIWKGMAVPGIHIEENLNMQLSFLVLSENTEISSFPMEHKHCLMNPSACLVSKHSLLLSLDISHYANVSW